MKNQEAMAPEVIFGGVDKYTWILMKNASFYLVQAGNEFFLCIETINEGHKVNRNDYPYVKYQRVYILT